MCACFGITFSFPFVVDSCSRAVLVKSMAFVWCVLCKMKCHLRIFQEPAVNWCKMRPLRQRIKLNSLLLDDPTNDVHHYIIHCDKQMPAARQKSTVIKLRAGNIFGRFWFARLIRVHDNAIFENFSHSIGIAAYVDKQNTLISWIMHQYANQLSSHSSVSHSGWVSIMKTLSNAKNISQGYFGQNKLTKCICILHWTTFAYLSGGGMERQQRW